MEDDMRTERMICIVGVTTTLVLTHVSTALFASGHGPLFGAATPTLVKGAWQFDQAWMGQAAKGPDAGQILRSMISAGLTPRIQLSVSAPIPLSTPDAVPSGRMMSMMSFNRDVEVLGGWRFHVRPVGEGARFESTVFAGATLPLTSRAAGLATAPAAYAALTTGYASRTHYFWAGGSYQHPGTRDGDRLGRVATASIVYGYRPAAWRRPYPKPDLRWFVESVFDATTRARRAGEPMPDTGGRVALVGPSLLLLYKAYGVEGGILFPVYQRMNGTQPDERFRFGVNFTYFFWPGRGGH
jgi:hypothetical protein